MKVFQIVNSICHYDASRLYENAASAAAHYPSTLVWVDAPDYVFEGWGFDETKSGDERFIRPEAPEGFVYDIKTGTYYNPYAIICDKIKDLKDKISETDYIIIKSYEYSLMKKEIPYNLENIHNERENYRSEINKLKEMLKLKPEEINIDLFR